MVNGYITKYIRWLWQYNNSNKFFQVAHSSSNKGCWMWKSEYGNDGAIIWKNRNKWKLIICCHKSKLKYTTVIELFAKKCKERLTEKFFIRNYKLNGHIISKINKKNNIINYIYILNKYNLNYDVINYISEYIDDYHVDIRRYY